MPILVFLSCIVTLLNILFLGYIIYAMFKCKWGKYPTFVSSHSESKQVIINLASEKLRKIKKKATVVDLGCGSGALLIPLAKKFPNHLFYGYEWDFLPYFLAKIKTRNLKNVFIIKKDFMTISYHNIDIILCFLIKALIPQISQKMQQELPNGSYILSELFPLNLPEEKKHTAKTFGFPCAIYQYLVKKD